MTRPDDTEPSAEALEYYRREVLPWLRRYSTTPSAYQDANGAKLLDRFRAAGVREERPVKFLAWAVEMFGPVELEPRERGLRFTEEAVELAHALNIDRDTVTAIIDRVYGREPGNPTKEAAQSLACLECLALVLGMDLGKEADAEFARVQTIRRAEWTRRHAAKVALGFAGASHDR